ncbi:hypothetical protein [Pseudomonas alloputida]|uniref:hypothetical protein n=1 Tax=Pseudomonas alloputida TaxID=1940621 RepID=UPI003865B1AE
MNAFIFDSETTGFNEPHLVEAAWLQLAAIHGLPVADEFLQRYKPGKPIELGACSAMPTLPWMM